MKKIVFWVPRILAILFVLFLATFSMDVFGESIGFFQKALAFLVHNIPAIILAIVLWISWKRAIVGGIVFTLAGLLYAAIILFQAATGEIPSYGVVFIPFISGPALLVGLLFLLDWRVNGKSRQNISYKN